MQKEQVCGKNHEEQECGLGPVNFEVPIRYPCGGVKWAIGYRNLAFKEGILDGDIDWGAIRLLGGIESLVE